MTDKFDFKELYHTVTFQPPNRVRHINDGSKTNASHVLDAATYTKFGTEPKRRNLSSGKSSKSLWLVNQRRRKLATTNVSSLLLLTSIEEEAVSEAIMNEEEDESQCLPVPFSQITARNNYIEQLGFVKISYKLVQALLPYQPFVEVFAGTGALAKALASYGARVIATDDYSWEKHRDKKNWVGKHFPVINSNAINVCSKLPIDHNLLCSWPPYKCREAGDAVKLLRPGVFFCYIADPSCCAATNLNQTLSESFELIERVSIDHWEAVQDSLSIYRKM